MSGRKEVCHCVCLSGYLPTFCCGIGYLETLPAQLHGRCCNATLACMLYSGTKKEPPDIFLFE